MRGAYVAAVVLLACVAHVVSEEECASGFRASSPVIPCPTEWYERSFLVPHEAIRLECRRLAAAWDLEGETGDAFDAWNGPHKATAVLQWFRDYFTVIVRTHHETEESIYFPFMEQVLAARGVDLPPLSAASHADVLAAIDATKSALQALDDVARAHMDREAVERAELAARVRVADMLELLALHLAEEERLYPPLLAQYSSPQQEAQVIDQIVKELGYYGNKVMLPSIWESMATWGGPAGQERFASKVPQLVLFLHRHVFLWDAKYNAHDVMDGVARGTYSGRLSWLGLWYKHVEMIALATLCTLLSCAAFAACRAPRITNPRKHGRRKQA